MVIDGVSAHDNPGYAGSLPYTGHGVILANTNGGVIQNSVAYNNGKVNGSSNVGLWTYQSNAVTIQNNVAYGNRSPGGADGGGFDIDGGVTNSVIQYNRSYKTTTAPDCCWPSTSRPTAWRAMSFDTTCPSTTGGTGTAVPIAGPNGSSLAKNTVFHNNTIIVDRNVVPKSKGDVWFPEGNHKDVDFVNNVFVALNGAALIAGDTTAAKATFVGNSYWTAGGPVILESATYASVQAWANTNAQEKINGMFTGLTSDPQFADSQTYQPSELLAAGRCGASPGDFPWPAWLTSLGLRRPGRDAIVSRPWSRLRGVGISAGAARPDRPAAAH